MTRRELLDADWRRLRSLSGFPAAPRRFISNFSPRFTPIVLLRTAQTLHRAGWRRTAKLASLLNFVIFGLEVPARLDIGPGLTMPHTHGTVLGAGRIGADVTIFHQVTLGAKFADFEYDPATRPVVEDGVTITVGAKVLGPLTLGKNCVIGANAVVLEDVPEGAVVGGVPARILSAGSDPA